MASVTRRQWSGRGPTGRRVRKVAFGYSVVVDGKQVRQFNSAWSREDAQEALAKRLLGLEEERARAAAPVTLGEAVERYLKAKARKRSVRGDALLLGKLAAALRADTPLAEVTAAKVSAWKAERLAATNPRTGEPFAPATVNRYLAALRHLLRLAREEWDLLAAVPRVRLEREPQGRVAWLEPDEEARLLEACRKSRNPELLAIVTVALETGMRRGELLGLQWHQVDMSRGVVRLEVTKSGRRREVPMRRAVYDVLAAMPGPREGRVFRTRSVRTAFEAAARRAGLDSFVFHGCRHHFASWFVMRGGSLQALKEILGHSSMTMVLRYSHLSPGHLRAEMAKTEGARSPVEAAEASADSTWLAQGDKIGVERAVTT